jgi:hypothetical protein
MPAGTLSLALNTWLVLRAREREPDARTFGGLPNDFLTRGAASLLVVDHVICDEDGLAAENAMPWVSTRIFQRLREAGLLRPRPYRTMMSAEVMARLEAAGLLRFARQIMKRELRRIQHGEVATEALELPPALRWINSVLFTSIDEPATLHYDYHDAHFANLSPAGSGTLRELGPPLRETAAAEAQSRKTGRLVAAMEIVVPEFRLLPPITARASREAMLANLREEKRMMYQYIYGAMPHTDYEHFRSADEFKHRDRVVDTAARFREAERNIEILVRVREATAQVRHRAQRIIRAVVEGQLELEDVRQELRLMRGFIDEVLSREHKESTLRLLGGAEAVLGLTRIGVGLLGAEPGGLVLTGLEAAKSLLEAEHYREERSDLKKLLASLGRRFPLAWLAGVYRREGDRAPREERRGRA